MEDTQSRKVRHNPALKSVQQPPDHRGVAENGPFNPPLEQVQVTRGKRGGLVFIVNGKIIDRREQTTDGRRST